MTSATLGPSKGQKFLCVMVGLPARGKSFTAQRLARYMSWLGYPTRVFNVGAKRREVLGARHPAGFFDPSNLAAEEARNRVAEETLSEALAWLSAEGRIALYDATNSTRSRRDSVVARCRAAGQAVLFIEVVNDDPAVIEENVRAAKLKSPDYEGVDPEEAVRDFRERIAHYERAYEPVERHEGSYLRVFDRGNRVELSGIEGYLPARIAYFLTNLRVTERPIWLTRHGESMFNVVGRIGGDEPLSPRGELYARRLVDFVAEHHPSDEPLEVWTSTLKRTRQTAEPLGRQVIEWRSLNEIDAGVCDGMTYREIAEQMPVEFERRQVDKFNYRYPRGESYADVIQRLDPVIVELERHRTPVLVVAHNAVCRALYAYFRDIMPERCTNLEMPLHTLIELRPRAYGCDETRYPLTPELSLSHPEE